MAREAGVVVVGLFLAHAAAAQFIQQGSKLVAIDAAGPAGKGKSAAISADGNIAIVGGPIDNNKAGAAWVYSRSGGVWSQQRSKLVGSGATRLAMQGRDMAALADGRNFAAPGAAQGFSVAISADGNTVIVGGPFANSGTGAAWVYTRNGGVWSPQGGKLMGTGVVGTAVFGFSVAISGNGTTAIVGGPSDSRDAGAAWVFTRTGEVWSQQGTKLVGTGAVGSARQGWSVAISGDGNTAIVGGLTDNDHTGGAWMYGRSGEVWSQQGSKLVGTGAVWPSQQGSSVAISHDGNTAIVGGPADSSFVGGAWVYGWMGGLWLQQGSKLVSTDAVGATQAGGSVAISADGNTAAVGGPGDKANAGATWVYLRTEGVWSQQGKKLVGSGAIGAAYQGSSVAISADGSTVLVGGPGDNKHLGAAWVFGASRPPAR
jgi:hypothetical protein